MIAALFATLIAPVAWAVPPCENVRVVESTCSDDKATLNVNLALPGLPGSTPVRSLDMTLLRIQSTPEQAYKLALVSGGKGSSSEIEDTTEDVKMFTFQGPCGGTLETVDIAWQAWVVKDIALDVHGQLSKASSWLDSEPEALKRGIHGVIEQRYGRRQLVVRWVGANSLEVQPTMIDGVDGAAPGPPLSGASWSDHSSPVFSTGFAAKRDAEPLNDPFFRVQVLELESIQGICRMQDLAIGR